MTITDVLNLAATATLISAAIALLGYKRKRVGVALFGGAFLIMAIKSAVGDSDVSLLVINGSIALIFVAKFLTTGAEKAAK
ncbi:hypothetical protein [Streptomyces cucumeris]|uniref:hypothetical protein n=1 Tax=Streptomyces cucumeris TaxID=2962890 RepID=UPI003D70EFE4